MAFLQRVSSWIGPRRLLRAMSFYPPYLGAGVKIARVDSDVRQVRVEMKLSVWNRNYVGTQFGGSLYSMCDPFFMLMVMINLGPDYIVWDKSATIDFLKPGRGRVYASFEVTEAQLDEIRAEVAKAGKVNPAFEAQITDDQGQPIARVRKVLSVRRKPTSASAAS